MSAPKKLDPAAIRGRAAQLAANIRKDASAGHLSMSIPARPDRDTDFLAVDLAEKDVPALLERIEALEGALRDIRDGLYHQCCMRSPEVATESADQLPCAKVVGLDRADWCVYCLADAALAGQPEAEKSLMLTPEQFKANTLDAIMASPDTAEGFLEETHPGRFVRSDTVKDLKEALRDYVDNDECKYGMDATCADGDCRFCVGSDLLALDAVAVAALAKRCICGRSRASHDTQGRCFNDGVSSIAGVVHECAGFTSAPHPTPDATKALREALTRVRKGAGQHYGHDEDCEFGWAPLQECDCPCTQQIAAALALLDKEGT